MMTQVLTLCLALGLGSTPPDVYTLRNRSLEIPIRVNEARRAELKELELHVSTDQGRTWTLINRATPDQKSFNFHARVDGLYWFNVCAIDQAGKREPEDLASAPPALKVLIDTQRPALSIIALDRVGEEIQVVWECQDPQANVNSFRLEFRTNEVGATGVWLPVPVTPSPSGQIRFRPGSLAGLTVRAQIIDATGTPSVSTRELADASPAVAQTPAPATTVVNSSPSHVNPGVAAPIQQAGSMASSTPAAVNMAPAQVAAPVMAPPQPPIPETPAAPALPPTLPAQTAPMPPTPAAAPAASPPTPVKAEDPASGLTPLVSLKSGTEVAAKPPVMAPVNETAPVAASATPPRTNVPEIQHIRDRQVVLDFEVERKGPSGVKKIEVYITQDEGQSWYRWSDTTDTNPPLTVTLPKEDGLYGFRMVLYSGVNQSYGPPRPGDAPDVRVLIDRTSPQVELFAPTLDHTQPNALLLRFKAQDQNLNPGSVSLSWSARPDSGWQPIAMGTPRNATPWAGVKECTWVLPPDVPDSVYIRLSAKDQAGNVGEFITRDPVTVDLHKPMARVKSVIPVSQRRVGP